MRKFIYTCIFTIFITALMACVPFPYAKAAEIAPTSAGVVRTAGGSLNVRAAASTGSSVVGSLRNGAHVSIVEPVGNFYKVLYDAQKVGYCHKNYISVINGSRRAVVNTVSTSLNVRSGPSTSYGVVNSLYKGEAVVVISTHGGFYKILYRGTKLGYASTSYIKLSGSSQSNTNGYTAVYLSVPDYKQYDSRWSSVRLGNSSRTIYEAGCLTTAIAMERSYIFGYTVTPATVARNSNYTSGGAIYWPAEYAFITGSDYLSRIHSLLKQGKPVLVGSKNTYGGQHWVIVTGFTPNGNLSADDFSVNDPGSSNRKTLSAFFVAYPNFYKVAYRKS